MTHSDIYTKFMIEYDKANITSSYPSLTKYEIATILDKAYLALIAQKVTGMNTRKAGFEVDTKAIEDLRPLVKTLSLTSKHTYPTTVSKNERIYEIPNDLLYYVSGQVCTQDVNGVDKQYHKNQVTKLINHDIADNFRATSTNLPWIKIPVVYLEGNDVHLLVDPCKNEPSADILLQATYISKPAKFALTSELDSSTHVITIYTQEGEEEKKIYSEGTYNGNLTISLFISDGYSSTFNHWEFISNGESTEDTTPNKVITVNKDMTIIAHFD